MFFKVPNCLAPEFLSDLPIKSESHLRALRNTNTDSQLPMKTKSNGQKRFSHRGVKSWNVLPLEIKHASSL